MKEAAANSGREELFDDWVDRYDEWFRTPVGRLVRRYEGEMLLDMLRPQAGESILDAGCGSGIFTLDVLARGSAVVGLDISYPMLRAAVGKTAGQPFCGSVGDLASLPFADESFDRVFSMTAIEFITDAHRAMAELHRVVRPGGTVVVTTLNSLSPWAKRRTEEAAKGHRLFQSMTFRSPEELARLALGPPTVQTAIHFAKNDDPEAIPAIEARGRSTASDRGAFVALKWRKSAARQQG